VERPQAPAIAAAAAAQVVVVRHDQLVVERLVDVELDRARAQLQRALERSDGVLGRVPAGPAVRDHEHFDSLVMSFS
jgi:hypothetical protein